MKSFASVALFGAALVAAAPLNERDIVWHTTWTEVTETVMTTTTKWVAPGSEISAAAANPGGDFHETAVHFSEKPAYTHSDFSFPSYSKPAYETPAPPAPTTSTAAAPVPTTTSTQAPPPPPSAPTTVSTTTSSPPPPPPAPTTPTETYVAPTTTSTYVAPTPTSTYVAPPPTTTSTYVAPTPTSIYTPPAAPTTSTTAAAPAATTTPASYGSGSGSSSGSSSTYSNVDLTYYTPGMGSCGIESTESEAVVAVAANTMTKSYSGNPNLNPLCGKKVSITANGVTKTATIVDTCPGCLGPTDLDLSPSLFSEFASESVGRITGASWSFA